MQDGFQVLNYFQVQHSVKFMFYLMNNRTDVISKTRERHQTNNFIWRYIDDVDLQLVALCSKRQHKLCYSHVAALLPHYKSKRLAHFSLLALKLISYVPMQYTQHLQKGTYTFGKFNINLSNTKHNNVTVLQNKFYKSITSLRQQLLCMLGCFTSLSAEQYRI